LPLLDEPVCGFTGSKCNRTTELIVGGLCLIAIVCALAAYPIHLQWYCEYFVIKHDFPLKCPANATKSIV
jgi:hypothetical protein